MPSLNGAVVFVTGANGGIGNHLVRDALARGARSALDSRPIRTSSHGGCFPPGRRCPAIWASRSRPTTPRWGSSPRPATYGGDGDGPPLRDPLLRTLRHGPTHPVVGRLRLGLARDPSSSPTHPKSSSRPPAPLAPITTPSDTKRVCSNNACWRRTCEGCGPQLVVAAVSVAGWRCRCTRRVGTPGRCRPALRAPGCLRRE